MAKRVIATQLGFFGGTRRRVGDQFDVPDNAKAKWFVPVAEFTNKRVAAAKRVPTTLSEGMKAAPKTFVDHMQEPAP